MKKKRSKSEEKAMNAAIQDLLKEMKEVRQDAKESEGYTAYRELEHIHGKMAEDVKALSEAEAVVITAKADKKAKIIEAIAKIGGVVVGAIGVGAEVFMFVTGLHFEEEGVVTSSIFKGLVSKIVKKHP